MKFGSLFFAFKTSSKIILTLSITYLMLTILPCLLFSQRDTSLSKNCFEDINCPTATSWRTERNCAIRVVTIFRDPNNQSNLIFREGSGVLLNQLNDSKKIIFVTAAHIALLPVKVIGNDTFQYRTPETIALTINYQNLYCTNYPDFITPINSFSFRAEYGFDLQLLTIGKPSLTNPNWDIMEDYALFSASDTFLGKIENRFGSCLCGWDARTNLSSLDSVIAITHPRDSIRTILNTDNIYLKSFAKTESFTLSLDTIRVNKIWAYGITRPGSSGGGYWGKSGNSKLKLIGIHETGTSELSCSVLPNNFGSTALRFSTIYQRGRMWRFLANGDSTIDHLDEDFCLSSPNCFDGENNQCEKGIDCGCDSTKCSSPDVIFNCCPSCQSPLGTGGGDEGNNSACQTLISDFVIPSECYSNGSNLNVYFKVNSNCPRFVEIKRIGENTPTNDFFVSGAGTRNINITEYTATFNNINVSLPLTQTYVVTVWNIRFGDTTMAMQRSFTIFVNNSTIVNAGQDRTMCLGNSEYLGGNPTALPFANYVVWTCEPPIGLNFLDSRFSLNPIFTPTVRGTYRFSLEASAETYCSGFDTLTVTVDTVTRPAVLRLTCVISPNRYQAGRIYTAETCSTTVSSPTPTDFVGAQEVNLLPGFTASAGATFTARIAPCAVEDEPVTPPQGKLGEPQPVSESKPLAENEFEVDVFPNPNDGTFTVRYKSLTDKFISVRVYDNIGRKLIEKNWNDRLYDFEVDLSSYASGVYHVVVSDGEHTLTKKVLKK